MKTITDDPEAFFDTGGWTFLDPESDVSEDRFEPPSDKTNSECAPSEDWADAQADLSLRLAHSHTVGFVTRRLI